MVNLASRTGLFYTQTGLVALIDHDFCSSPENDAGESFGIGLGSSTYQEKIIICKSITEWHKEHKLAVSVWPITCPDTNLIKRTSSLQTICQRRVCHIFYGPSDLNIFVLNYFYSPSAQTIQCISTKSVILADKKIKATFSF